MVGTRNYNVVIPAIVNHDNVWVSSFIPEKFCLGYEGFRKLGEELEEVILPIPAIDILEGKVVRLEKGIIKK